MLSIPARAIGFCCALVAGVGCTYDWPVGAPLGPGDAALADAALADASLPDGATSDGGNAADGTLDAPAEGSRDSAPAVGPVVDCVALAAQVKKDRAAAKKCMETAGECTTTVDDECGCPSFVGMPTTVETATYRTSAAALKSSRCMLACPSPCPQPGTVGLCALTGVGAGVACKP